MVITAFIYDAAIKKLISDLTTPTAGKLKAKPRVTHATFLEKLADFYQNLPDFPKKQAVRFL